MSEFCGLHPSCSREHGMCFLKISQALKGEWKLYLIWGYWCLKKKEKKKLKFFYYSQRCAENLELTLRPRTSWLRRRQPRSLLFLAKSCAPRQLWSWVILMCACKWPHVTSRCLIAVPQTCRVTVSWHRALSSETPDRLPRVTLISSGKHNWQIYWTVTPGMDFPGASNKTPNQLCHNTGWRYLSCKHLFLLPIGFLPFLHLHEKSRFWFTFAHGSTTTPPPTSCYKNGF